MKYEFRMFLYAVLVGGAIIGVVFSFPSLTTGGGTLSAGVSQAEFEAAFGQELAYCQAQPDAVDCRCFANISGLILADAEPRVPGARYADKEELARGQAARSC
ncbi:hypothetical protein [uncultured Tateyamaria sp.]|uniref:hypothetical protein n=1 Tax=uncultured Tateyamaria sp. TaxID=455651 RepID=UPI0026097756|nr:hypothetical protein [uncultured Tateyamaria sp.]